MIGEPEVRRMAGRLAADPMIVDLDYVLGCFLATLTAQRGAEMLRFKGGTCLRKCYYTDYRFSEDLDFTAVRRISSAQLQTLIDATVTMAADQWQIDFGVRPPRVEMVDDEYSRESYQVRLYYQGPLRRAHGDPRAIRVDVSADEAVEFPVLRKSIIHPYSDSTELADAQVACYDLLEVVAEKIRALCGQRRNAISRDIYDLDQLATRATLDVGRLAAAMPRKMRVKGLAVGRLDVKRVADRKEEFRADWQRNLMHLLPAGGSADFEAAWERACGFLTALSDRLRA